MTASIRLEGYALHRGVATSVTLARVEGPIAFERDGRRLPLASFAVQRSDAGVAITDGQGFEVDLVEHLLAALGGLGVSNGVTAIVDGPELPILDGGARRFAETLCALGLGPTDEAEGGGAKSHRSATRPLTVTRAAKLDAESSTYTFEPGDDVALAVETEFDHPALGTQRASWDGSPATFLAAIAPARTFGFHSEKTALWSRGRAELAKRDDVMAWSAFAEAVVVFDARAAVPLAGQRPPEEGEIARHKLLDLIGDFAFYGGPPAGRVFARRPGHTASHRIIRDALALGILSRR